MSEAAYNKGFPVSWEQMHRDARALAWRLLEKGPYKGIIAITRGGLVPAAIIATKPAAILNGLKVLKVMARIC